MKIIKFVTFLTMLLIATFSMRQPALAATYYVDRNLPGSDNNNGTTEATPFLTIPKCVAVAINPGDVCLVKNGTYPEGVLMRYSGTAGKPITLKNYSGHSPVIRFATPTVASNRIEITSINRVPFPIQYVTIEGFEITNGWDGIKYNAAENLVIRGNKIHHNASANGITGYGYRVTIERNLVYHNGPFASCTNPPGGMCNQSHGMYITGKDYFIFNNIVYDNLAYGIQAAGYPFDSSTMPNTNHSGFTGTIANNTIAYENYRGAIVIWQSGATGIRVENNILYENANHKSCANVCGSGIDFANAGTGHIIRNNHFYVSGVGGTSFITNGTAGATYTESGNVCLSGCGVTATNPNMVNAPATLPASPNFALQSDSQAIDKGVSHSLISVDFVGRLRPQGSAFDIGAHEGAAMSASALAPPRNLKVH